MAGQVRRGNATVDLAATASGTESAASAAGIARRTARHSHVVVVGSLAALDEITNRGVAPSLPPGSQVKLTLLPEERPERRSWERSISRYGSACGCQPGAAALVLVIGALIAADVLLGLTLKLPELPVYASWILICVAAVVLAKLGTLCIARRSLKRVGARITAAAIAAKAS